MIRASLISLIYNRIMDVQSGVDKGQAVTLMGTDCDAVDFVGIWGYDVWGQSFEAVVALALIYREAREICILTLSFIVGRYLSSEKQEQIHIPNSCATI